MVTEPGVNVVVRHSEYERGVAQGYGGYLGLVPCELAAKEAVPVVQAQVHFLDIVVLERQPLGIHGDIHQAFLVNVQVNCGSVRYVQARHHKAQQVKAVVEIHVYPVLRAVPVRDAVPALEQHRERLQRRYVHQRVGELEDGPVGYVRCVRKVRIEVYPVQVVGVVGRYGHVSYVIGALVVFKVDAVDLGRSYEVSLRNAPVVGVHCKGYL